MAKYKVGDKVVVREDLRTDVPKYYMADKSDHNCVVDEMLKYRGNTLTIKVASAGGYRLEEDNECWTWTDEMFSEPKNKMEVVEVGESSFLPIFVEKVIFNDPATILFYRLPMRNTKTGEFEKWSDKTYKVVSIANADLGDVYDKETGFHVCMLKAFRRRIDKELRKI